MASHIQLQVAQIRPVDHLISPLIQLEHLQPKFRE